MFLNKQKKKVFLLVFTSILLWQQGLGGSAGDSECLMRHRCKDDGAVSRQVVPRGEKGSLRETVAGGFLPDPVLGGL